MRVNSHAALGEAVRAARLRLGLSQGDLASNSGMSRQSLVALEHGTGNPTWETVLRVAAVLGMELDLTQGSAPSAASRPLPRRQVAPRAPNPRRKAVAAVTTSALPVKKASPARRPPVDLQALLASHTET